ncbi:unnamed protein product [Prorocentrum cordatum]|uniref:Uncharacterized protein n=1 Tax=Prorocentrum cordatum TaxID=2364126 RepID=A0ABN9X7A6_9DINO|nr:unnamed protein product [Polarella glacialis]
MSLVTLGFALVLLLLLLLLCTAQPAARRRGGRAPRRVLSPLRACARGALNSAAALAWPPGFAWGAGACWERSRGRRIISTTVPPGTLRRGRMPRAQLFHWSPTALPAQFTATLGT